VVAVAGRVVVTAGGAAAAAAAKLFTAQRCNGTQAGALIPRRVTTVAAGAAGERVVAFCGLVLDC
jgi:hypothetical protein